MEGKKKEKKRKEAPEGLSNLLAHINTGCLLRELGIYAEEANREKKGGGKRGERGKRERPPRPINPIFTAHPQFFI